MKKALNPLFAAANATHITLGDGRTVPVRDVPLHNTRPQQPSMLVRICAAPMAACDISKLMGHPAGYTPGK